MSAGNSKGGEAGGRRFATWANLVSLSRIPLAAAFFLISDSGVRTVLLLSAAASDYLDGWLARRHRQGSRTGELLDPLTDKLFVVIAIFAFANDGALRVWHLAVLFMRDVLVIAALLIARMMHLPIHFRARFSGKVVTVLQIATVLGLVLFPPATTFMVLATGAATLWAIADYSAFAARSLRPPHTTG